MWHVDSIHQGEAISAEGPGTTCLQLQTALSSAPNCKDQQALGACTAGPFQSKQEAHVSRRTLLRVRASCSMTARPQKGTYSSL